MDSFRDGSPSVDGVRPLHDYFDFAALGLQNRLSFYFLLSIHFFYSKWIYFIEIIDIFMHYVCSEIGQPPDFQ